jgi:hypothetical protein
MAVPIGDVVAGSSLPHCLDLLAASEKEMLGCGKAANEAIAKLAGETCPASEQES